MNKFLQSKSSFNLLDRRWIEKGVLHCILGRPECRTFSYQCLVAKQRLKKGRHESDDDNQIYGTINAIIGFYVETLVSCFQKIDDLENLSPGSNDSSIGNKTEVQLYKIDELGWALDSRQIKRSVVQVLLSRPEFEIISDQLDEFYTKDLNYLPRNMVDTTDGDIWLTFVDLVISCYERIMNRFSKKNSKVSKSKPGSTGKLDNHLTASEKMVSHAKFPVPFWHLIAPSLTQFDVYNETSATCMLNI
ncbi:uncharacterized protein LOC107360557 [Tetranychus urticae]|uniref:Uncharacterized protein n=1 Tax=Tetranychus urticae TaxID=32264 RepID=T1K611_TETUR|nr:uncharacterized protein LOC107360557 [Tetranychus urticae]